MTQEEQILKALQRGRKITALDALSEWNCFRLGARCYDLRQKGYNIITETVRTSSGKNIARYSLAK